MGIQSMAFFSFFKNLFILFYFIEKLANFSTSFRKKLIKFTVEEKF